MRLGLVLAILVLAAAPCGDAAGGWRLVASNHTYAIYAKLDVSASVSHPAAVALRVISQPAQNTFVKWSLVCSKGSGTGSTSGSYTSQTTRLQPLRLPMGSPRSCRVAVQGHFPDGGGTLTLRIYSRT
jgi:hypothetical protein